MRLAFCLAASAAATMACTAQPTYSANMVGYVNVILPPGHSLIANPLNSSDNSVSNLFASLNPLGADVFTWNGSAFEKNNNDEFGGGWQNPRLQLPPGVGFLFRNPTPAVITNTYVGEVLTGSITNDPPLGYSLLGSKLPQSGFLQSMLGLNPGLGDNVYLWNGAGFIKLHYDEFGDGWPLSPIGFDKPYDGPLIQVGVGFFYQNIAGTVTWVRNFNVGP